jgi:hypothetical protein
MDEEEKHALGVLLIDEGETVAGGAAPRAVVEGRGWRGLDSAA